MEKDKKFLIPEAMIIVFKEDDIITASETDFATIGDGDIPWYS